MLKNLILFVGPLLFILSSCHHHCECCFEPNPLSSVDTTIQFKMITESLDSILDSSKFIYTNSKPFNAGSKTFCENCKENAVVAIPKNTNTVNFLLADTNGSVSQFGISKFVRTASKALISSQFVSSSITDLSDSLKLTGSDNPGLVIGPCIVDQYSLIGYFIGSNNDTLWIEIDPKITINI